MLAGDNKGYAAYLLEKEMNGDALPGLGPFVAGFCTTNLGIVIQYLTNSLFIISIDISGDVSPNTNGAKCIDTGLDCDGTTSTCNGKCKPI